MTHEEIIKGVIELLRQHKSGLRGSIHQEPYKGDFFKLFAAAFNAGLITNPGQRNYLSADALTSVIVARAPELVDDATWDNLLTFWQEWSYAWKHQNQIQK